MGSSKECKFLRRIAEMPTGVPGWCWEKYTYIAYPRIEGPPSIRRILDPDCGKAVYRALKKSRRR